MQVVVVVDGLMAPLAVEIQILFVPGGVIPVAVDIDEIAIVAHEPGALRLRTLSHTYSLLPKFHIYINVYVAPSNSYRGNAPFHYDAKCFGKGKIAIPLSHALSRGMNACAWCCYRANNAITLRSVRPRLAVAPPIVMDAMDVMDPVAQHADHDEHTSSSSSSTSRNSR